MPALAIIAWREVFKSLSKCSQVEAFTVAQSLTHLTLLDTLGTTVSDSLGQQKVFIHALVAADGSSATGTESRSEPLVVAYRAGNRILHALHALLLVLDRVETEGGVGITTNNIEDELAEVTARVVFFVEDTDQRLEISQRIRAGLGDVEGNDETVALFNTEHETILPHATRITANAGRVVVSAESTTLFESLLFKQPVAVNFRNTVFAHFL